MADYEKMYNTLFWRIENTIEDLKKSLQEVEDIYISTDENDEFTEKNIQQSEREED